MSLVAKFSASVGTKPACAMTCSTSGLQQRPDDEIGAVELRLQVRVLRRRAVLES